MKFSSSSLRRNCFIIWNFFRNPWFRNQNRYTPYQSVESTHPSRPEVPLLFQSVPSPFLTPCNEGCLCRFDFSLRRKHKSHLFRTSRSLDHEMESNSTVGRFFPPNVYGYSWIMILHFSFRSCIPYFHYSISDQDLDQKNFSSILKLPP